MLRLACLAAVLAVGCAAESAPPAPPAAPEEDMGQNATALPDAPKMDPAHAHKKLTPAGDLLLETKPDPADPKKAKPVRVLVQAEVCLRAGQLELFMCRKQTKEHEAILRTAVDAQFLHAALVAAGATPGKPVQFVDPKTGEEAYKPASGPVIKVGVCYTRAGEVHTHPAQEWVRDTKTRKPMTPDWVFAGSYLFSNPDEPKRPPYYAANGGDVISLSNFPDSMLDLPVKIGQDNDNLGFDIITEKVPPLLSKVWVILTPGK